MHKIESVVRVRPHENHVFHVYVNHRHEHHEFHVYMVFHEFHTLVMCTWYFMNFSQLMPHTPTLYSCCMGRPRV
jgi:hypothetical protein